jgi:hypothetical protein
VIVGMNRITGRSAPLPDEVKDMITKYEGLVQV